MSPCFQMELTRKGGLTVCTEGVSPGVIKTITGPLALPLPSETSRKLTLVKIKPKSL